jgi:hypothetical protein
VFAGSGLTRPTYFEDEKIEELLGDLEALDTDLRSELIQ